MEQIHHSYAAVCTLNMTVAILPVLYYKVILSSCYYVHMYICKARNELTPAALFSLSESLKNVNNNTLLDYTTNFNNY